MNSHSAPPRRIGISFVFALGVAASADAAEEPVRLRVFLLAGQSNMEGQAVVDLDHEEHYNGGRGTLARVLADPALARFDHLRDERGRWSARDDVHVWYRTGHDELKAGPLSIGFGVYPGAHHFGPELMFGHAMGDRFEDPVLLVKAAWGGKSLAKDFRPPSAGGDVGPFYTKTLSALREALERRGELFAGAEELEPSLEGLVWFQGWNDMVDEAATREYEENFVHLVADLRRDLDAPALPVVIAETGNCDNEELRGAQAAAARRLAAAAFVPTVEFRRPAEDSPNVGHGHHWFGNAESVLLIGEAMGRAMGERLDR